jgi:hypothetical protein
MAGYTSVADLAEASRRDIEQVSGINKHQANVIHVVLLKSDSGGGRSGSTRRTALGIAARAMAAI